MEGLSKVAAKPVILSGLSTVILSGAKNLAHREATLRSAQSRH